MNIIINKKQNGVGLVEVLVALLLLAIAILGFSALQMRAVQATDESLVRTKSLNITRNLAEAMRSYPDAYVSSTGGNFTSAVMGESGAQPTLQAVINASSNSVTVDSAAVTATSCLSTVASSVLSGTCTLNQLAARDALAIKKMATDQSVSIAIVTCPGTTTQAIQTQMCIVTAWEGTEALLSDTDTDACANEKGTYKRGSKCLISEAY